MRRAVPPKTGIVPVDSPLRRVPLAMTKQQSLHLDGIRLALEMLEVAYGRLVTFLEMAPRGMMPQVSMVLLDAWSMVDSADRLRRLIQEIPGWKGRGAILRMFPTNLRTMRNMPNHIDKRIRNLGLDERGRPGGDGAVETVWGSLSWSTPPADLATSGRYTVWTLLPGTPRADQVGASQEVQSIPRRPVDQITLRAYDEQLNLTELWTSIQDVASVLDLSLRKALPPAWEHAGADMMIHFDLQSVPPDTSNTPGREDSTPD
jgi:hypothetical protein